MPATPKTDPPVPSLAERLAAVGARIERIGHDVTVTGAGTYQATSIDKIADDVRPLLAEHGIAIVPVNVEIVRHEQVVSASGAKGFHVVLAFRWEITDGVTSISAASTGASIDYSDKAYNKASTFARKNLLVSLLNLSTGSEDPERHSPEAGHAAPTPAAAPGAGPPPTVKQTGMARRLARELHGISAERLEVAGEWASSNLGVEAPGDFLDWLLERGSWDEGIEDKPPAPVDRHQLSRMIDALVKATEKAPAAPAEG